MDILEQGNNLDESALLQHYDVLEASGMLEQIQELKSDLRFQREIIEEAFEIFRQPDIESLTDHLVSSILDKFVPSYLVFLVQSRAHASDLDCMAFRHLKPMEETFPIESLRPFGEFFSKYPHPVSVSLFEHESQDATTIETLASVNTEILVPVLSPSGLMGVILVGKKLVEGDYSNQEITYINRLMQFGSVALQNLIHYVSASRDARTRLYNHSFFMNRLDQELERFQRYGAGFSLLMCDLDHFKLVNDRHGHPAGDAVLFQFARLLERTTRTVDTVARYGGEEFVVLLPETSKAGAWVAAERIRMGVEASSFSHAGVRIPLTCSIGGCHAADLPRGNGADLLQAADSALYWSKEHGRNLSAIHRSGLYLLGKSISRRRAIQA